MTKHTVNYNENVLSTESQDTQILSFLLTGCPLTSGLARELFGCDRLAARIHSINKKGWNFEGEMITLENGKRIAEYKL
jgi:hypothetical protein